MTTTSTTIRDTPIQRQFKADIVSAGYTIRNVIRQNGYMWIECTDNRGEDAVIVRQNAHAYHWFSKLHAVTGSGCSVLTCDSGGLGDAIGTDSEMKTYKKLINGAPTKLQRNYKGLYCD